MGKLEEGRELYMCMSDREGHCHSFIIIAHTRQVLFADPAGWLVYIEIYII